MKNIVILVFAILGFSFCPSSDEAAKEEVDLRSGFLITVQDNTTRQFHKYIVETKDSVNVIFTSFFKSELELGEVDRPISIFNGKHDFYIARVNVFDKPNGKKGFKNLKYPPIYVKPKDRKKEPGRAPVYMEF